jgi:hypothetical protein
LWMRATCPRPVAAFHRTVSRGDPGIESMCSGPKANLGHKEQHSEERRLLSLRCRSQAVVRVLTAPLAERHGTPCLEDSAGRKVPLVQAHWIPEKCRRPTDIRTTVRSGVSCQRTNLVEFIAGHHRRACSLHDPPSST